MTGTITEYKVFKYGVGQLEGMVIHINAAIREGWQPAGGLHSARVDNHEVFIQAMVKYDA